MKQFPLPSLILCLSMLAWAGQSRAQTGNTVCNPLLLGMLNPADPTEFMDNNLLSGSEPDIWPDCGGGNNTRYYGFRLPPGFTNVLIELIPEGPRVFELALLDSTACFMPGPARFIAGTDACGLPGQAISIPDAGVCLSKSGRFFLKVSGQTGQYTLRFTALAPTCSDGCENGSETGVDSLTQPDVTVSSLDSTMCSGDFVLLQLDDPGAYTSIVWNNGVVGPMLGINKPGLYSVTVSNADGCIATTELLIKYRADCIWPGDVDRNLRVQARDILPIGLGFGKTGPARSTVPFPPTDFEGQSGPDWAQSLLGVYDGLNYKYLDADGNGIIDEMDVQTVRMNYGHEVPSSLVDGGSERWGEWTRASSSDPPLFIVFDQDSVEAGDTLRGTVYSGTSLMPLSDLYGYSFKFMVPTTFIEPGYIDMDFSGSWLDDDGEVTNFYQYVYSQGFVDLGFTRTDQTGRSGHGALFSFGVIVVDNLDGVRVSKTRNLPFSFQQVLALNPLADSVGLNPIPDTVTATQYCDSRGLSSATEFIDAIRVNSKTVNSGNNGGYRRLVVNAQHLKANTTYTLTFRPGFVGPAVSQHWRVWLDINGDGDFDDPGELMVNNISSGIFQRPMHVPDTATLGWTHMRVQMKRFDGTAPEACEDFAFGEVEDYFVEIRAEGSREAQEDQVLRVWPNPASARVMLAPPADAGALVELRLISLQGRVIRLPLSEGQYGPLSLDLGAFERGAWVVQLLGEGGLYSGRVVLVP